MSHSIAVFCCGAFFGAALYINLVQQPAALALGPAFAARYFAPMYRRAAPLQVTLAFVGTLAALWTWWKGAGGAWLVAGLLLFSVVPITLIAIAPVTNRLLDATRSPEAPDTEPLLRRWSALHALRTLVSGAAFALLLMALVLA